MRKVSASEHVLMVMQAKILAPPDQVLQLARTAILSWSEGTVGAIPQQAYEGLPFELDQPGDPLRILTPTGDANRYWALRLNRIDTDVPGRIWTVEAHLASDARHARFGMRMSVFSDGRHNLRPPRLIKTLHKLGGLQIDGFPLDGKSHSTVSDAGVDSLVDLIVNPDRTLPVVVFSEDPDGKVRRPAAKKLGDMATGIAHVFLVDARSSFRLTDRLGKVFSTFNGAIRIYPPHFLNYDDPFGMPLFLPQRIARISDNALVEWLLSEAALLGVEHNNIDPLPRFSSLRTAQANYELRQIQANATRTAVRTTDKRAEAQIFALMAEIAKYQDLQSIFDESLNNAEAESKRFQADAQDLRSENFRLRSRITTLSASLQEARSVAPLAMVIPETLEDLELWIDTHCTGNLAITPKALRLAAASLFQDVHTVYQSLLLLAGPYREAKLGDEGAFKRFEQGLLDLGLKITPVFANGSAYSAGAGAVQFYNGQNRPMEQHIKNQGNTRDPARCLRIYFFWDEENEMCVVGALPGHIETFLS